MRSREAALEDAGGARKWEKPTGLIWLAVVGGVLVLAVAAILIGMRVADARAHDRQVDEFYCTLSGVGPFDQAPSGKLCVDVDG